MSDQHREIAMNLARQFVVIAENYLPDVIAAVQTTKKPINFGCTVSFRPHKDGLIHAELRTRAPKIPRDDMASVSFTLQLDAGDQLELVFAGHPNELLAQVASQEKAVADAAADSPGAGYIPEDNATVSDQPAATGG